MSNVHHIVLEVAADAVLRAEHRRNLQPRREQGVEGVSQVYGNGGGVSEESDALAFEGLAQFRIGEEPVDSEEGHRICLGKASGEANRVVKVGLVALGMSQGPIGFGAVLGFKDRG